MGRTERLYAIDRLLRERGRLSLAEFLSALEVSRATFRRDIDYLRDRLHAPIIWDPAERRYCFDLAAGKGANYSLPGLWFNDSEIYSLIAMQRLLEHIEPGLLAPHLSSLQRKLLSLLQKGKVPADIVTRRIRINQVAPRKGRAAFFDIIAGALLHRRRLKLTHYNRHTDATSSREVSPQRLIHHRDNWYLDAWCHLRNDLRSFALDAVQDATMLPVSSLDVSDEDLGRQLDSGYGIFSGKRKAWATLRFSPYRARWVANEMWHPDQEGRFDRQGRYELRVPYRDFRELLGEVLRYGPDCEVLAPDELRKAVIAAVRGITKIYKPGKASAGG